MTTAKTINQWLCTASAMAESLDDLPGFLDFLDTMNREALAGLLDAGCGEAYGQALLVKISNLLLGKYHYRCRHDFLLSSPFGLIVDPANGCPLHCPGCLHNRAFQNKVHPDWPAGLLEMDRFRCFLREYGPYASVMLFFNWGEPLLNKNTPTFVQMAKSYMLRTSISSNLSVEFDAEALVLSGLDHLTLSIDGAGPDTYGRYRRGGDFKLVLDNVRKLAAAKKKHDMGTPILSWQFLLFEHNKHEKEAAKKLAHDLGVNEVRFCLPYDVPWDGDLEVARDVVPEVYTVLSDPESVAVQERRMVNNLSPDFQEIFRSGWSGRLAANSDGTLPPRTGKTCKWLYSIMVMDALGRILPCCYAPRRDSGLNYVFSPESQGTFNGEYYRYSRHHFVETSEICRDGGSVPRLPDRQRAPYCVACQEKFGQPLINHQHLKFYFTRIGTMAGLSQESIQKIAEWE